MDNDTNLRNSCYLNQLNKMLIIFWFFFIIKVSFNKEKYRTYHKHRNIFQANIDQLYSSLIIILQLYYKCNFFIYEHLKRRHFSLKNVK